MARLGPNEILNELTRVENGERESGTDALNRRQYVRHQVRGEAELQPIGRNRLSSAPITVQMRDLSRGGVGLICSNPLDVDSTWRIHFFCLGYVVGSQSVIIRRCTQIDDGTYFIGTQFVLDAGIMAALGIELTGLESDREIDGHGFDLEEAFLPPSAME